MSNAGSSPTNQPVPNTRPASAIKVGTRNRKDMGDLEELAHSIDEVGLLHSIVITPDDVLIAGERRLRAWPKTKFADQEIPVHVVDLDKVARGEWAENTHRKSFTASEIVAIKRALEPTFRAEAKERQIELGKTNGTSSGNFPEGSKGRAADKIAAIVGVDRKTMQKAEAVIAAAETEPEMFGELVAEMDRSGKIDGSYQLLRAIRTKTASSKYQERFDLQREHGQTWRELRDAITKLAGLPQPVDVVALLAKMPRVAPLIEAMLVNAGKKLTEFEREWNYHLVANAAPTSSSRSERISSTFGTAARGRYPRLLDP